MVEFRIFEIDLNVSIIFRKHFIDILTVVCREVLNKRGRNNQCMVPIYHSTLRMDLYMPTT